MALDTSPLWAKAGPQPGLRDDAKIADIAARVARGESPAQIGTAYGVDEEAVEQFLEKFDHTGTQIAENNGTPVSRPRDEAWIADIAARRAAGQSDRQIAKALGKTRKHASAIRAYLRRLQEKR